ncbi:tetratricopeptide repeat protein [Candidatus Symbiopectobacterium sp. NZEC135]|uniref:tetratricopeptide repeat protein n=1 Tax=Candidatus Symbiopectobacterium sp. NZEC135 TaxID=2820471 RepID=UPI002227EB2F|nr:tetratricopeptide repeat protein [Candidatus Symbiopectobacterium sp. NZEC135]MCW2480623.1 tetratricopeptide repeat protein [Candidatus Symbiopectobacterium sp. NZEC135]
MKRQISVFIASPGDLSNEREYFRKAINQLNVGFGDGADLEFNALGWEDTLASTGRRNQSVINEDIDRCDVFILVMNRRWGQPAPDAQPFSSYTEEEFHRALERWKKEEKPEIFVFFKRVDPESEADAGPQLKKVMEFRKQLEETRQVLYHYFDDEKSFVSEVDRHLRAFAKDELPKSDKQRDMNVLPLSALNEVEKAKNLAITKMKEAEDARDAKREALLKVEAMQLQMAEDAAQLSLEGRIEYARQKFAQLVVETMNLRVLLLGYEFYKRTGDLDSAFLVLKKLLDISGPDEHSQGTAMVYGNLGVLYKTRGELERAEDMYQKSLAINEALGHKAGMASQYGNLGVLYKIRGELDRAEEMYRKSLAINVALNRKKGMANQYGNLGVLYRRRGDFDLAEEMFQKSLVIFEALGLNDGMASNYGNLGNVYKARGELEHAEKMYQKALVINEALERKEGMAKQYGNLGTLYMTRGEFDRAEEMYQKSLAINVSQGFKEGMANQYGNLGNLYKARGEFQRAEAMYQKALPIFEYLKSPLKNSVIELLSDIQSRAAG